MAAITSGVFFQGRPPATGAAHAPALDVLGKQLLTPPGHGTGVDTEEPGDTGVAAPTAFERFKPCVQSTLAFVEQAGEQHDSGAQLVGHEVGIRHRSEQPRGGQQGTPGAQLLRLAGPVGGAIQELAGNFLAGQLALLDELAQGILSADVEQVVQLLAELSRWRIADHRRGGGEQGAGGREPHVAERPQPVLVEVDELLEGVVAAPMGVAGTVREFLELAKRGASGARTERRHYLGQRGDGLLVKQVDECSGGVLGRSHCGTITNTIIVIVPQRVSGIRRRRYE